MGCCHWPEVPAWLCVIVQTPSVAFDLSAWATSVLPAWGCLCLSQKWFSARFPLTPSLCSAQLTQQQGALAACTECPSEGLTLVKLGSSSRWALVSCKSPEPSSSLHINVSGGLFSCLAVTDWECGETFVCCAKFLSPLYLVSVSPYPWLFLFFWWCLILLLNLHCLFLWCCHFIVYI